MEVPKKPKRPRSPFKEPLEGKNKPLTEVGNERQKISSDRILQGLPFLRNGTAAKKIMKKKRKSIFQMA